MSPADLIDANPSDRNASHSLRGLLAFLPDEVNVYPRDDELWRKVVATSKSTRKRRRRAPDGADAENQATTQLVCTSWNSVLGEPSSSENPSVLALFLWNPDSVHAQRLLRRLVQVMDQTASGGRIHLLILTDGTVNPEVVQSSLAGSGCCHAVLTTTLQTFLNLFEQPSLRVWTLKTLNDQAWTAQKLHEGGSEMVGLEWNPAEVIADQWLAGQSALSISQRFQAGILQPSPTCQVL